MAVKDRASGLIARGQCFADRVVSPETRSQFYNNISTFASQQPLLAGFLLIQLLLSTTPILLFLSFTIGTLALSLIAATLFSLFWIGVALLVLVPTLFITVSLGIAVWIWAVGSFLVARWVYNAVPGGAKVSGKVEGPIINGKKLVFTKAEGKGFESDVKEVEEI